MRYFFSFLLLSFFGIAFLDFSSRAEEGNSVFSSTLAGVHSSRDNSGTYRIDASVSFDSPRTAFYFSFPREILDNSGVTIVWHTDSGDIERQLDIEDLDILHYDARVFSSPWITTGRSDVTFSIISHTLIDPEKLALMTSYSERKNDSMGIENASAATRIVSRAEWGADESYRYADSSTQKQVYQEYLKYRQAPKTQSQLDAINIGLNRRQELERLFPNTEKFVSVLRYENGHRLVWPIQKTRQVNRIVIHHTAESLDKQASDEVYLRDIYKYHAITRGWGDIGYNYIIGQRGIIYEGRAGGDYVVGAHVLGNNEGSVGISVIGNFENIHLNRDQRAGLESAISYVAEKYGITLSADAVAISQCSGDGCKEVKTHTTRSLVGHRDLDTTACPGKNIYSEISGFIARGNQFRTPIYNTETSRIDPIPADEVMNMMLSVPSVQTISPSLNHITTDTSQKIRIRLSYSGTTVLLEGATVTPAVARIGFRKVPFNQGFQASVVPYKQNQVVIQIKNRTYTGSSFSLEGEVVRIASWSRVPAWDTTGKYNDNLFRGKLIVRNENGKLYIVNELPIESYLKGMGEVSNTDLPEKIKTIVVSARSYAYYYMDKKNRKYNTQIYDGSDDPDSFQKYLGYGYEMRSPNVAKLVDETRGRVIKYKGVLIKPWYFSSSNGRTKSYQEYCESNGSKNCMNIPYLQSVSDPGGVGKVLQGHGVGISGVGATYFSGQGWDYQQIIQYYLNGVEILKK
ncbi:MAG: N-acetylmuramoyl-L-alanine amidase [Candidatus Gracilibacteria bacterium]|nr:N-acetylmuramoyl-L-alanine amidase [Candidatus Gracilibacteria bacterium]